MSYPFGIDISSWQSYPDRQLWMDISALTRHPEPVQFVFCRATHGMYADKAHAYYTRELDRFNIPNGSYAYMLPAHSARLQTDLFLQIAAPNEHRRHVIDMEAAQGLSRTRITDFLLEVLEIMGAHGVTRWCTPVHCGSEIICRCQGFQARTTGWRSTSRTALRVHLNFTERSAPFGVDRAQVRIPPVWG